MLEGITIKPLRRFADRRGLFTEIMRKDWKGLFQADDIAAKIVLKL
jgi:dTDP-4-dehydrorhamnose 3,5-epimerase